MEHPQGKGEVRGHREWEVELEHHLVKEEGQECHLGKVEEQGCCCQGVVEVEGFQVRPEMAEVVVFLLVHQN